LREFLSLDPAIAGSAAPAVRAEAVQRVCRVTIGAPVDFRAGGGGARLLATGWSYPEVDGVWSDGPSASLMFDLGHPPTTDLRFEFSLAVFQNPRGGAREVIIDSTRGQRIDVWSLSEPETQRNIVVPAAAWIGSRIGLLFRFDGPISPSELGVSEDPRALSIKLRRLCIHEQDVGSTPAAPA
jgi:hypothetical protein